MHTNTYVSECTIGVDPTNTRQLSIARPAAARPIVGKELEKSGQDSRTPWWSGATLNKFAPVGMPGLVMCNTTNRPKPGRGRSSCVGLIRPGPKRRSGYTVIELMVVVALVAITIALAVPHFSFLVDRWRVHHGIAQLQSAFRLASIQAIRTGSRIAIQAKPATCRSSQSARNWSCGLTVFQDTNQNKVQDANESTLQDVPEFHALTVVMHAGANRTRLVYGPYGTPIATPSRFEVYPVNNPGSQATQTICLSFGGRMRVKAGLQC
jgi:prepilin-type N-terminal cleavage/methylation domain-containing protein